MNFEKNPLGFDGINNADRAAFMLDMMANTDCRYEAAKAALHYLTQFGPIGTSDWRYEDGDSPRSVKIGYSIGRDEPVDIIWLITIS